MSAATLNPRVTSASRATPTAPDRLGAGRRGPGLGGRVRGCARRRPRRGRHRPDRRGGAAVAYPLIDVFSSAVEAWESPAWARVLPVVSTLISLAASVGLAVAAATADAGTTLAVFGFWAIVSGAVQLGTAAMRRRAGSHELPMIVSGAISTAAGFAFVAGSSQDVAHLTNLAGYAVLGAVLYLIWAARARR